MDATTRRKINVEEALWRQMRARAAEQGITVSELVVTAVTNYMEGPKTLRAVEPAKATEPTPIRPPVATNAVAAGSGPAGRDVRAAAAPAPLDDLPDDIAQAPSFTPVPKPTAAAKPTGRPLGRR